MPGRPTIFHVAEDAASRDQLAQLPQSGMPWRVESYATMLEFLRVSNHDRHGCLIVDLRQPTVDSLEILRLQSASPILVPVILLLTQISIPLAREALKQGVADIVEKPYQDQALVTSVRQALELDQQRRQERSVHLETAKRLQLLTSSEREVLDLLVQGNGNKNIATALGISYKTVESRRGRIMPKLKCESLAELLAQVLSFQCWLKSRPSWETVGLSCLGPRSADSSLLSEAEISQPR